MLFFFNFTTTTGRFHSFILNAKHYDENRSNFHRGTSSGVVSDQINSITYELDRYSYAVNVFRIPNSFSCASGSNDISEKRYVRLKNDI
ncbi:unnamed protein product [Amoebophrya sp. A120]|nr:unnamed protein product [Amoebophrya sp. A120]|eukprot:GSA120T00001539001.1